MYTSFVDLEKAFDSVWRKGLLHQIRKLGIAGKMCDIIKSIYEKTTYSIIINSKLTPKSSSTKGIKQCDTLSTLLFNIYLNDLPEYLSKDPNVPVIIDNTELSSLMFADDLVPVSTTNTGLQQCIDNLSKYCKKWNLTINLRKKTKIVTFSKTAKIENTTISKMPLNLNILDLYLPQQSNDHRNK